MPASATFKEQIGVGIDTARYGHRVTFLREDRQPAAGALTILETRKGYEQLEQAFLRLKKKYGDIHLHIRIDAAPLRGIYKLTNGKLKICFSAPGKRRPTDFGTKVGDHHSLNIYARTATDEEED